jgi:predicted nucleic-acid-binding protein
MPAIDTNVLVRPLVDDDPQQTARVRELVEECARRDELLFVPLTVSLELEWVLRARYSFTRDEVLAALVGLLESREFEFQDEPSVEHALYLYRSTNADFAECLHLAAAIAHNRTPLLTFDRTASRLEGAQVIL